MNTDTAIKSALIGLTAASLLTAASIASAAGKLNVSNWAEYMAEDTISNFAKEYDNAIKTFGRMLAPGLRLNVMGCIAACYAQLGRDEEARIAAEEFRNCAKSEGTSEWDNDSWREYWLGLFVLNDPEPIERLLDGLRKAGLP